jgi:aryl-alcohol dehydrogenase-like predicted oxidoreductase
MMFDKGETFAGVPFETGLKAVTRLKELFPVGIPLAHVALRWILLQEEVSCIIPGASSPDQVRANLAADSLHPISGKQEEAIRTIYEEDIKPSVHQLW